MAAASATPSPAGQAPVAVVCVGMAGSGKTTFMQRINAHLHAQHAAAPETTAAPYVLNLDPAVRSVPFESNIDIRDSVNYKEVMKQYNLGPNGGILTSLNLFSTKVDQIMGILEKRCLPPATEGEKTESEPSTASTPAAAPQPLPSHILLDTPGQIEVFVWSASGSILLSALASSFPTVIAYIIDTPRSSENTSTFMSNMLYAISILYKTRLPMVLVFNKTDVKPEAEAVSWMRDFESFQAALRREEEAGGGDENRGGGGGYMGSLLNSMSLVLEEFYNALRVVGVSSMTGAGVEDFFAAVEEKRVEFDADYRPELERRRREAEELKATLRDREVSRMMRDMDVSSKAKRTGRYARETEEAETVSDAEDMEADEASGMVDPDEPEDGDEDEDVKESFADGLKARYERALEDGGGRSGAGAAASYIRASQR